jgi:hypothetical protein
MHESSQILYCTFRSKVPAFLMGFQTAEQLPQTDRCALREFCPTIKIGFYLTYEIIL